MEESQRLEQFEGPSAPGEFVLFVLPRPEPKYKKEVVSILSDLLEKAQGNEIEEIFVCLGNPAHYKTLFSPSDNAYAMAASMISAGMSRMGFTKG